MDLCHLNKGHTGDTFKSYFEELEKLIEEETAADEGWHGISHMSQFISICDLIAHVKAKLPKDTPIPSEATVLYSFAPPNMFSKSSQYYTGKINLKHAIQQRHLISFHADSHYCNTLFSYMWEMTIEHKENCLFISCDNKAWVDYGEPGTALSTVVR